MNQKMEIELTSEDQFKTKAVLESLLKKYDLSDYFFTRKIRIIPDAVPHSYPVLTLNTRYFDQPDDLLSEFLHEEIHWFLAGKNKDKTDDLMNEFKKIYQKVPVGFPEGARDETSTYLHLAVCWLELQADKRFLGKERAYEVIKSVDVYRWIYKTILKDEQKIGEMLKSRGLLIEPF